MWSKIRTTLVAGTLVLPVAAVELYGQQSGAQQRGQQQGQTTQQQQQQRSQMGQQGWRQQGQQQQARGQQQADRQTQQLLAADVKLANEFEAQLSQWGQQQAESEEVKQYAQQMVRAHQQLNQELAQAVPSVRQASLEAAGQQEQFGQQARQGQQERFGQQEPMAQREESPIEDLAQQTREQERQAGQDVYGMAAGADSGLDQLTQIHAEVYQNMLQQQKQALQEKSGAEFDKAFMGCQIGAHQAMLAKLQAYQNHVSPQAQQVLQQAEQETQQHLQEAKQIMRQLEQQRSS